MSSRGKTAVILLLFLAAAIVYARLTPPGEAPDEPAHIAYVHHLVVAGELPPVPARFDHYNYEAHQPPLAYLFLAGVARTFGYELQYRPEASSALRFDRPSRAFEKDTPAAEREVHVLRLIQLLWGSISAFTAVYLTGRREGMPAAVPFVLAPQFLFVISSVNNDALLIAAASVAAVILLGANRSVAAGAGVALAFAVALFAKGSALFLLVPVAVAIVLRRRERSYALTLFIGVTVVVLTWFTLNLARFGSLMPPVPQVDESPVARLVLEPQWVASLWKSSWAKLGWLNISLPVAAYSLFLLPTVLIVVGAVRAVRERSDPSLVALSGAFANLALVVTYMLQVDWQPQGRYLFPSLVFVVYLAALASPRREALQKAVTAASVVGALIGAAAGAYVLSVSFSLE